MGNWRIWHSARSFCEFIVDHTSLCGFKDNIEFRPLAESDASKTEEFCKVPDHIKKILYLDAADVIIEYDSEPILCIEETKEAGTGHNAFQRFARIAAAVENGVPAIYIMPQAKIIERKARNGGHKTMKWDTLNPAIFKAFDSVMKIFDIPALFFFYPSDYQLYKDRPHDAPHIRTQGLMFNSDRINYAACPAVDSEMERLFEVINLIVANAVSHIPASTLRFERIVKDRWDWMVARMSELLGGDMAAGKLSPLTATKTIDTSDLLQYLAKYSGLPADNISELLSSRPKTVVYVCDAAFRGDPYPGALAAIDYMMCRRGKTFEDRDFNLVMCFGRLSEPVDGRLLSVESSKSSVNDFIADVNKCCQRNLLTIRSFSELKPKDIGRYYMQVRYGSTYSKSKHIRVYSYFADAIIFPDGALWRQA